MPHQVRLSRIVLRPGRFPEADEYAHIDVHANDNATGSFGSVSVDVAMVVEDDDKSPAIEIGPLYYVRENSRERLRTTVINQGARHVTPHAVLSRTDANQVATIQLQLSANAPAVKLIREIIMVPVAE